MQHILRLLEHAATVAERLSEVDATCTQPDDVVLATPQNLAVLIAHFAGKGAVVKLGDGTPVLR